MKRLVAVAVAALALAGSAGADVFRVVPSVSPTAPAFLPSADVPNTPGSISFPPSLQQAPALVEERSYDQLLALWQRDGALYGVPWQVLAAINKVESNFGRNMGPSSAGAIGWMQFMPSTWERWGVDADGDGIANPWSAEDAIAAAARYLAASGGTTDI
jgi:soluble lytic murein transglycosylase-like protein